METAIYQPTKASSRTIQSSTIMYSGLEARREEAARDEEAVRDEVAEPEGRRELDAEATAAVRRALS